MPDSISPTIQSSTDKLHEAADFLHAVATGPASGVDSSVTNPVDASEQITAARAIEQLVGGGFLSYAEAQALTETQKAQALTNAGAEAIGRLANLLGVPYFEDFAPVELFARFGTTDLFVGEDFDGNNLPSRTDAANILAETTDPPTLNGRVLEFVADNDEKLFCSVTDLVNPINTGKFTIFVVGKRGTGGGYPLIVANHAAANNQTYYGVSNNATLGTVFHLVGGVTQSFAGIGERYLQTEGGLFSYAIEIDYTAGNGRVVATGGVEFAATGTPSVPSRLGIGYLPRLSPVYGNDGVLSVGIVGRALDDDELNRVRVGHLLERAGELTPLPVFIMFGQSNMEGSSVTTVDAWAATGHESDVLQASHNEEGGVFGDARVRDSDSKWGPELPFGTTVAANGTKVAIIKVADGGVDITRWSPGGDFNKYVEKFIPHALEALVGLGYSPRVAGACFMQGESDALDGTLAANYEANLSIFIAYLRGLCRSPTMPVVMGEVTWAAADPANQTLVRDAQNAIANSDPNIVVVPTNDLDYTDNLHLDAGARIALGNRFAAAFGFNGL